eukprot:295408-Chlamydomonas_euryale.AAC.1
MPGPGGLSHGWQSRMELNALLSTCTCMRACTKARVTAGSAGPPPGLVTRSCHLTSQQEGRTLHLAVCGPHGPRCGTAAHRFGGTRRKRALPQCPIAHHWGRPTPK